jgi:hypothetical protein
LGRPKKKNESKPRTTDYCDSKSLKVMKNKELAYLVS